ncbi:hypothetical protein SDC9_164598 [bioreactor metagenome]|uniref:Uncharacterized protein n=1 Tax=bioreactor metagenome TaxID=1076179 RepID=A0A645FU15_9ZZZZ
MALVADIGEDECGSCGYAQAVVAIDIRHGAGGAVVCIHNGDTDKGQIVVVGNLARDCDL